MTRFRLRILAGTALGVLAGSNAWAQQDSFPFAADEATRAESGQLRLSGDVEILVEGATLRADEASYDPDSRVFTATGAVEVVGQDSSLKADRATYDRATETVTADGNVRLFPSDGSVEYADSLIFDSDLRTGVATNFSAFLPEYGALAAANIIRRDENYTELNRAIFTACELCDAEGRPKVPTWSVEADKVVRDEANQSINYRNAVVRIRGVPVLVTPFFSHADPLADRRSGLLAPRFQHTDRRGLSYEQPYLWAISPYQDLIVRPQFNTEVAPFLDLEARRRFYTGLAEAQFGFTYERDFNSEGQEFGPTRTKAYILAAGEFEPRPQWLWGFTAEQARDRRVFDQYSISIARPDRGLFRADDRRLISQLYTVRQGERSYFSVAALAFQSLRPLPGPPNAFGVLPLEDDDTLPFVGPMVEFRYEPEGEVLGGRLRLIGSGVLLEREASHRVMGAPGADMRRVTLEADWRRTSTFPSGVRLEPFLYLRGDAYAVSELLPTDLSTREETRGIAIAGVNLSWPLVRVDGSRITTVEPIVQLAISPDADLHPGIPNEDSLAFEYDYSNLFELNRFPGFDLYEGGQRLNVGVRTTVDWGAGRSARFVVGQTFRADDDPILPGRTGLDQTTSNWVLGAEVTPVAGLFMFTNARFDGFDLQRIESGVDAELSRLSGYVRYMRTTADFMGLPQEDIEGAAQFFFMPNWGIFGDAVRDLERKQWRQRSIGLVYADDCLRFELGYQRDNNPILGQQESSSVVVRLTLATLGDSGYTERRARRARAFR